MTCKPRENVRTKFLAASVPFPLLAIKTCNKMQDTSKIYGTGDSRMVTHCSTNPAITCLTRAERTGSRAFMFL
jgi:hypothetical protein